MLLHIQGGCRNARTEFAQAGGSVPPHRSTGTWRLKETWGFFLWTFTNSKMNVQQKASVHANINKEIYQIQFGYRL